MRELANVAMVTRVIVVPLLMYFIVTVHGWNRDNIRDLICLYMNIYLLNLLSGPVAAEQSQTITLPPPYWTTDLNWADLVYLLSWNIVPCIKENTFTLVLFC